MCGRYQLNRPPAEIARWMGIRTGVLPNVGPRYNIAPTQTAPVVRRHPETGERHLDLLRWGLVPHWAKDPSIGARMINARSETIATTPAFRDSFRSRRCLVPADGFYEWKGEKPPKQPYAIARADGGPIAFAGLWTGWRDPASGEVLRSFTIATTDANATLRPLHERMPVILGEEDWPAWLGDAEAEPAALQALLRPCPDGWLRYWPVSRRVGNVREDDAGLLEPVEPEA